MTPLTIIDCMSDPELFGKDFTSRGWRGVTDVLRRRDGSGSWDAWRSFLAALYGLPMSEPRLAAFRASTGRADGPSEAASEAYVICGRRAGKSRIASLIAVYEAAFVDHREFLAPGETPVVALIARDRAQARVLFRYVKGLLKRPMLSRLVVRETASEIELSTGASIEIMTAGQSVRGYTLACAVCDETAFWASSENCAEPDREILSALRPALSTLDGKLVCISSPYRQTGVLYEAFRRSYGQDGPVLVWRASTETMNPTVSRATVERAIALDPEAGRSEWLAEWRSDLETFLSRDLIDRAVVPGRHELPARTGVTYVAFTDPSGGRHDAMTLAVAHQEDGVTVLDRLEVATPPFSPELVVRDFAAVLRSYGLHDVVGDRYAGEWPVERFRVHGVSYSPSERTASENYLAMLPLLTSGTARLLDHRQLRHELAGLERRTGRSGKDAVSHRVGAHDDCAASVAGACALVAAGAGADFYGTGPVLAANLAPEPRGRVLHEREFALLGRL